MYDVLEWWRDFERRLTRAGFVAYIESPTKANPCADRGRPCCLTAGCVGEPEYHDYMRDEEYMGFIVCKTCGGVWNPTTHERFH